MLNFKSKHPETRNRLISKTWLFLEAENQMINVEIYFTLFKSDKFSSTLTHTHTTVLVILSNLVEFMLYFLLLLIERWKWARKYLITKKYNITHSWGSISRAYQYNVSVFFFCVLTSYHQINDKHSSLWGSR